MKKLLKNCRLNNSLQNILIVGEYIERVGSELFPADQIYDLNGKIVLPGMIDLHTHVRDLEQTYKEDWCSASKAAMAGGVTTIFDMPNTIPPTDSVEHLSLKRRVAEASLVNFGLYAGATPRNTAELQRMVSEYNAAGIKIFMAASSANEIVSDEQTLNSICSIALEANKPVLTHCELQSCIEARERQFSDVQFNEARFHGLIRDRHCAYKALKLILKVASEIGNALHVLHVSTKEEMQLISEYKAHGNFPLTCEVTPHHLFLTEDILPAVGNFGKVNPPLRTREDADALFEALVDGTVDTIGSDHAPHGRTEKQMTYREAPSGFPGLETTMPLLIDRALRQQDLSFEKIAQLTAKHPARIVRAKQRGELKPGFFADLIVIDPNASTEIRSSAFFSKAKYSPFDGQNLKGRIVMTFINGEEIHPEGREVQYD
jgi:dihydroorotase